MTWETSDPPLSLPPLSRNFGENTSGIAFLRGVWIWYYFLMISTHSKVISEKLKNTENYMKNYLSKYLLSLLKNMRNRQISMSRYFLTNFSWKILIFSWKYCILKIAEIHDFWGLISLSSSPHQEGWCDVANNVIFDIFRSWRI